MSEIYHITQIARTVEPLYEGHTGTCLFVHCGEVVHSSEMKNVLTLKESSFLGAKKVSFVGRYFLWCPLLGESFNRGSTVQ